MNTNTCSLAGSWCLHLGDEPPALFTQTLQLPGSLQTQGFGNPVTVDTPWTGHIVERSWFTEDRYAAYREPGNIKVPFWLQPERHYIGVAWLEREIVVPDHWAGRRMVLFLERPHIRTTVWINDRQVGSQDSLAAPHVYDLGLISPGTYRLRVAVDNRIHMNVGPNAHSISDHTQTNWNGIIGRIELQCTSPVWMEDIQTFPRQEDQSIRLSVVIGNGCGRSGNGQLVVNGHAYPVQWDRNGTEVNVVHRLPAAPTGWDEFNPELHTLDMVLQGTDADHQRRITVGFREPAVNDGRLRLNGRPLFLRGTLDCAAFPFTGYPPMDKEEWLRRFRILRDYGFNHVRYHSWCPPEAAFQAADECGFYLQVECSAWANTTAALGRDPDLDAWLYAEGHAIIKAYGNHPSFLLMAYGNEPSKQEGDMRGYLTDWLRYWKVREPRRLHTGGAGWPALEESHYDNVGEPRLHRWADGLDSILNSQPPSTTHDLTEYVQKTSRPIIAHETGQWCAYPDFREIEKWTGLLRARNYEIFRDTLTAHHMQDRAHDFLMASGQLQVLCYREEIEAALRTKGFGGYQLLSAMDFPGQGTATVGWLNVMWEEKGYVTAETFRRFHGPTVLLARLPQRLYTVRDRMEAIIEIAHFGPTPLPPSRIEWELRGPSGIPLASGAWTTDSIPVGNGIRLGSIDLDLAICRAPAACRLMVRVEGTDIENDWPIWIYPEPALIPETDILITSDWAKVQAASKREGKVLFLAGREPYDVQMGFTSIFWNTLWTRGQAPHTLGIYCDPAHPVFNAFPTDYHTDWPWWELTHGGKALIMDSLPPTLKPLVYVIDDWHHNQRLGLLFEARLGKALVMVCGAAMGGDLSTRHAARQFRNSLLAYMNSSSFAPNQEIRIEDMNAVLNAQSPFYGHPPR